LSQCQSIAEQNERPQRDEQRRHRLQEQSVDRRGVLQAVIGHRVVGGKPGQREERQETGALADQGPIAREMRRGERQQQRQCPTPANDRQRNGRNMSDNEPANNDIAGPEQRRQREQ